MYKEKMEANAVSDYENLSDLEPSYLRISMEKFKLVEMLGGDGSFKENIVVYLHSIAVNDQALADKYGERLCKLTTENSYQSIELSISQWFNLTIKSTKVVGNKNFSRQELIRYGDPSPYMLEYYNDYNEYEALYERQKREDLSNPLKARLAILREKMYVLIANGEIVKAGIGEIYKNKSKWSLKTSIKKNTRSLIQRLEEDQNESDLAGGRLLIEEIESLERVLANPDIVINEYHKLLQIFMGNKPLRHILLPFYKKLRALYKNSQSEDVKSAMFNYDIKSLQRTLNENNLLGFLLAFFNHSTTDIVNNPNFVASEFARLMLILSKITGVPLSNDSKVFIKYFSDGKIFSKRYFSPIKFVFVQGLKEAHKASTQKKIEKGVVF